MIRKLTYLTLATILLSGSSALSQELRIGANDSPSVDPHFLYRGPHVAYNRHLYEPLVAQTKNKELVPGLAVSWTAVEPTRWRFKLRKGVKFHDGSAFTADDVVFSFKRVTSIPNNPAAYTPFLSTIVSVEKVDDETIDIVTSKPNPLIPDQTNGILIVSKKAADGKSNADFTSGIAAIGTGPYKYGRLRVGESLELVRNDDYWNGKPEWQTVKFRAISDFAARMVALETGEVDLIDLVPPNDAARLAAKPGIKIARATSNRIAFIGLNTSASPLPGVTSKSGEPLTPNPLSKVGVRKAISIALNRKAIADRIIYGYGEPSAQFAVPGTAGYIEQLKPIEQDLAAAKMLLAEAGYADGFKLQLWCPQQDVIPQTCQAIAQMIARAGITADVNMMPTSVYYSTLPPPKNPAPSYHFAYSNLYADALNALIPLAHSYSPDRNMGAMNSTAFNDPEIDKLLQAASEELDFKARAKLVELAMARIVDLSAIIPVVRIDTIYATGKGVEYEPGSLNLTVAMFAHPRTNR